MPDPGVVTTRERYENVHTAEHVDPVDFHGGSPCRGPGRCRRNRTGNRTDEELTTADGSRRVLHRFTLICLVSSPLRVAARSTARRHNRARAFAVTGDALESFS